MVLSGDDMRYDIMKYENIRSLRIDKGYTQKQIATYLGISQNTYSQYEVGTLNYPVDVVVKLADFYGVSTDYLLGRTSQKDAYPPKK
jgi:transcriptional regulator with XRE-family HTH domain